MTSSGVGFSERERPGGRRGVMVDIRAGSEEMRAEILEGESTSVRRASTAN